MTRMTGPDCAVMCNLINRHTYISTYIINRMTGPDYAVMCNLINKYQVHGYIHTYIHKPVAPVVQLVTSKSDVRTCVRIPVQSHELGFFIFPHKK